MRSLLLASCLMASSALADEAASASATGTNAPASSVSSGWATRSALVAQYAPELADRPRAIGAGLFEAGFQGGYQINSQLGFGEIPGIRYGLTDQWELNLLGARYIVTEDGHYIPGVAVRAQLHDLAYQANATQNYNYAVLRPGGFVEVRDRLPFHLAVDGSIGYVFTIQGGNNAPDGTPIQSGTRIPASFAPMSLELQWSPLQLFSFAARGGYLDDTETPPYQGVSQSDGIFQVAAIYNTSRFDLRVYFQSNWYANPALGYVPEVGASATVRL